MKKQIIAATLLTVVFLGVVVIYDAMKEVVLGKEIKNSEGYSLNQILFGVLAEFIRAIATTWLYLKHSSDKQKLVYAIRFGIVCSVLIGSIWLLLGVEFFHHNDKLAFVLNDGALLLLQGLFSGIVLWLVFKKK